MEAPIRRFKNLAGTRYPSFFGLTNGTTGGSLADLKQTNTMIVSTDQVAADAFGATLLGLSPADLPFIARAAAAGMGRRTLSPFVPYA